MSLYPSRLPPHAVSAKKSTARVAAASLMDLCIRAHRLCRSEPAIAISIGARPSREHTGKETDSSSAAMKSSITANGAAALYERNDLVAKAFGRCGIGLDGRSSPDWPRCSDDPHPIGRSLVGAGQAEAQRLCL